MEDGSNTMKGGSQKVMGRKRKREREREIKRERQKNEVYHTNCYWVKWRVHLFFQNFN